MTVEMRVRCKYDRLVPLRELVPYPKNRNRHTDEQIARLALLLKYQGVRSPIVVVKSVGGSEDGRTIAKGHGTIEAIRFNGWKEAPVVFQDFDDEDQLYAYVQSDNAIASWAELDLSGINADVGDLGPDFDIEMLGIKDFALDLAEKYEGDPDEVPETPKVAKTKPGELWLLGNHRVLCGDATDKADVERLMAGEKADMVFTDPPYGMNLDADYSDMTDSRTGKKGSKFKPVEGDDKDYDPRPVIEMFDYCPEQFWFGADYYAERIPGKNDGSWVIWDKRSDVETTAENAVSIDRRFGSCFEMAWSRARHRREFARIMWSGKFVGKTAREHDGITKHCHPTQKPIALPILFFERWGKETKLVWDGYLGSGSTLIACEKTSRRCFGMEIEPLYVDVILSRWAKFTGRDPVREDGMKWSELKSAAGGGDGAPMSRPSGRGAQD